MGSGTVWLNSVRKFSQFNMTLMHTESDLQSLNNAKATSWIAATAWMRLIPSISSMTSHSVRPRRLSCKRDVDYWHSDTQDPDSVVLVLVQLLCKKQENT